MCCLLQWLVFRLLFIRAANIYFQPTCLVFVTINLYSAYHPNALQLFNFWLRVTLPATICIPSALLQSATLCFFFTWCHVFCNDLFTFCWSWLLQWFDSFSLVHIFCSNLYSMCCLYIIRHFTSCSCVMCPVTICITALIQSATLCFLPTCHITCNDLFTFCGSCVL